MGSGVSIDKCVDSFGADVIAKGDEKSSLSVKEREELKALASMVFSDKNVNYEDVSQTLIQLKHDLFDARKAEDPNVKQLKEEFLKYLTIQVMQRITQQAVEDA